MEFECSVCNYTSSYKSNTERHINKQKKCGENPQIIEVIVKIICEWCNKSYASKDNLTKHYKICKVKKADMEEELKQVKKELQEANRQLNQAKTIVNNSGTINNGTINNTYNIQLRPYNNPRLPDDMDDIYEDAWQRQKSIQTYIERVHFNTEYPENHNMCITNLRSKLAAKVFNGDQWETKDQDKILDEIIANTNQLLDKWVKSTKKRREHYEKSFIEYMQHESKKEFDNETKNELKILLYDGYKNGLIDIKATTKKKEPLLEDQEESESESEPE